ncbi:hypothetical protein [Stenotrophobium rhamnosiphilum]|uniref:DUF2489 domain-containing protein n=1 Tax=Stenotrophobium rhamnosiphilum TaxID=2029166 RepID=A0A2T5MBN3_9GAMM|nr:hypothetical protein [Stenotrophobium rhamnosiphilum]PTU29128.1 hypothetical protein CJD38_17420 [Stenotrophobium rhamnosiphilum]
MNFDDIVKIAGVMLTALGGAVAILFGFSSWLGKVWADRLLHQEKAKHDSALEGLRNNFLLDAERFRTALKKSEFIFQKEYEAASALVALIRAIQPRYSHPDMDWHEACDDIALEFGPIEKKLENFLATHGAALSEKARDLLARTIGRAAEGKFDAVGPDQVSQEANAQAEHLFEELQELEKMLVARVHEQAST